MRPRIPEGDSWEDHATVCPNCGALVLWEYEHRVEADWVDPGYWNCDPLDDDDDR